jgi:hypothetical protein
VEIIYCSECGQMIPPGGIDEGKRYLKSGEPLCPGCYRQLSEEEHSGTTMVVSDRIVEQLASAESEPDYSPKPKTSKLGMKTAKRGRPSAHTLTSSARERRPSGPQGRARKSGGIIWLLVLAGGAALVAILVMAFGGGGEEPSPRREPGPPSMRTDPPPKPAPGPNAVAAEEKEKPAPPKTGPVGGPWRGTWAKMPGKVLPGMGYLGHFAAAFDVKRNRYILADQQFRVWSYSLEEGKWEQFSKSLKGDGKVFPKSMADMSLLYDESADRLLLHGACFANAGEGGFLAFDLAERKWTPLMKPGHQPRVTPIAVIDGLPVRYTGWSLERFDRQKRAWQAVKCSGLPPKREDMGSGVLAYDSFRKRFVLFGGHARHNDTWVYNPKGKAWTQLHPVASPSRRSQHSMCYDPTSDLVVLHGGRQRTDTWVFDAGRNSWFEIKPSQRPSKRTGYLKYHPGRKCVVAWSPNPHEIWALKIEPVPAGEDPK